MFLAWFEANKKYVDGRNLTLLKLEEASSLPRLDVCLMKKMA